MAKSSQAQINALLISINHECLTLMKFTLFGAVIYKFINPTSSQFVVVALERAGSRKYNFVGIAKFQKAVGYFTRSQLD